MHRCCSNTYTRNQLNQFSPINIVPTHGITCIHCGLIIHPDQFTAHSQMHIPSSHRLRTNKNHPPQKLSLNFLADEKENDEDYAIHSFLPDQIPTKESHRKKTTLKKCPTYSNLTDRIPTEFNQVLFDSIKHEDRDDQVGIDNETKQHQQSLKLIKRVKLKKQKVKVHRKHPSYFQNQDKLIPFIDEFRSPPKTFRKEENLQKSGYDVLKFEQNVEKQPITIQIFPLKKTKIKEKVGTISTKNSFFGSKLKNHSQEPHTDFGETKDQNPSNRQQCQQCKGFYCHQCGSDIPPQYRPSKLNLSPLNSFEIHSFYRDHVYKNGTSRGQSECQTCTQ